MEERRTAFATRLIDFQYEVIIDKPKKHGDGLYWSHLSAKNVLVLHEFAVRVGLKKEWFQNKPGRPHYDIKSGKLRQRAKDLGAVEVSSKYLVRYLQHHYQSKPNHHGSE